MRKLLLLASLPLALAGCSDMENATSCKDDALHAVRAVGVGIEEGVRHRQGALGLSSSGSWFRAWKIWKLKNPEARKEMRQKTREALKTSPQKVKELLRADFQSGQGCVPKIR